MPKIKVKGQTVQTGEWPQQTDTHAHTRTLRKFHKNLLLFSLQISSHVSTYSPFGRTAWQLTDAWKNWYKRHRCVTSFHGNVPLWFKVLSHRIRRGTALRVPRFSAVRCRAASNLVWNNFLSLGVSPWKLVAQTWRRKTVFTLVCHCIYVSAMKIDENQHLRLFVIRARILHISLRLIIALYITNRWLFCCWWWLTVSRK